MLYTFGVCIAVAKRTRLQIDIVRRSWELDETDWFCYLDSCFSSKVTSPVKTTQLTEYVREVGAASDYRSKVEVLLKQQDGTCDAVQSIVVCKYRPCLNTVILIAFGPE